MSEKRTATLFVNPVAGRGECEKSSALAARMLQENGIACQVLVSQYPGHITRVSSDLAARGAGLVVACGGDGTVNEAVNGIAGTETSLGVVPLGISNNFARALGLPKEVERACQVIAQGGTRAVDLIKVNGDKVITGSGLLGFDAEVAAFADARRKEKSSPNMLKLVGGLLKAFSFRPKRVELRFDGTRYFGQAFLVAFETSALSSWQSSDGDSSPLSNEPALDVCIVQSVPKWRLVSRFSSIRKKARTGQKGVTIHRTQAIHVQSMGPVAFYADGDFVTMTPFRLKIAPRNLRVLVDPAVSMP